MRQRRNRLENSEVFWHEGKWKYNILKFAESRWNSLWRENYNTRILILQNKKGYRGMVVHVCNPSTWEVKAGGLQVWGQPLAGYTVRSCLKKTRAGDVA
jgi:hypothetical protein